jgi:hypothetical protein
MSSLKATRLRLTIEKKIEILALVEKRKSKKEIPLHYGIASSTLSTFIKEKQKLEKFEENRNLSCLQIKKTRQSRFEQARIAWGIIQ